MSFIERVYTYLASLFPKLSILLLLHALATQYFFKAIQYFWH
jgi:hypothetical protein